MDIKFVKYTEQLQEKFLELKNMKPLTIDTLPSDTPEGGVYLFSEKGNPLYVGRTKRKIKIRIKNHVAQRDDCPFAFRLAREKTGYYKATYKEENSRKYLLSKVDFRNAYDEAKQRIKKMEVRYVHEPDPVKQALLEIYIAIMLDAKYNEFTTS